MGAALKSPAVIQWQKTLIHAGLFARTIPKAYGGYGAEPDLLKARIIAEEFARAKVNPGLGGQGISMLVPTLLEVGREDQKIEFIEPTLAGELVWCQGYSEPDAGSDLAALKTKAVLVDDHWVINGHKIWTSTAQVADWMFCLVRTDPQATKHKGISFLLFAMDTPGIEVRPLVDMTGKANFNEVFFNNVRVPKNQIVGAPGDGWGVANAILKHERDSLGNPNVTQARFNALVELMQTTLLDGKPVINNPVFRDRLMKIQGRVMALSYNELRILSAKINDTSGTQLARLIVKLEGTQLRHDLEALGIDSLSEAGLFYGNNPHQVDEGSWQRNYMFFLGLIIGGGTSQIQKNIIAERGLGLPRSAVSHTNKNPPEKAITK